MVSVTLSRRALLDIGDIEDYSIEKWGDKVSGECLGSIEGALNRLRENPGLLRTDEQLSESLFFYRVRQHYLVCALTGERLFMLTVKHSSMDLPRRIGELEPQLLAEAKMLYEAFTDSADT